MMRIGSCIVWLVLAAVLVAGCNGTDTTASAEEKKSANEKTQVAEKAPAEKPVKKEAPKAAKSGNPVVLLKTSMGDIKIKLNKREAPITVENFLQYTEDKFYDKTIFHRVISSFMIQGGGYTEELYDNPRMNPKTARPEIKNEAKNGLSNVRGSIAMARKGPKDSASSQFFINVVDSKRLDYMAETDRAYGYAVFGKVIEGMDTVDKIKNVLTTRVGVMGDVPAEPVVIESVRVVE